MATAVPYNNYTGLTSHGQLMANPTATGLQVAPSNIQIPRTAGQVQQVPLPVVPVGGGYYNDGMEFVWHGEFSRLFGRFCPPHIWYLSITSRAPTQKWKYHGDNAKVRFCCQDCGNGWTSMKGRVTFWFNLNLATNEGHVQFKLYGQQCKKCNSGKFEYVMWYPEEVSKVMCNVFHKVGQTYYGFIQSPIRVDRRPGRPRNQHNSDLCQACHDGECDHGRPVKSVFNVNGVLPLSAPVPNGVGTSNDTNHYNQTPMTSSFARNTAVSGQQGSVQSSVSSNGLVTYSTVPQQQQIKTSPRLPPPALLPPPPIAPFPFTQHPPPYFLSHFALPMVGGFPRPFHIPIHQSGPRIAGQQVIDQSKPPTKPIVITTESRTDDVDIADKITEKIEQLTIEANDAQLKD